MTRKWLTRALTLGMMGIAVYFGLLSRDTAGVPIKKSAAATELANSDMMRGEDIQYKSFDAQGNQVASGKSSQVTMSGEKDFKLEDGLELEIVHEGNLYLFKADQFENLPDGSKVMTVASGKRIHVAVKGGLQMETPGPLIYTPEGMVSCSAPASFRLGQARGQSVGLRCKPDVFLELQKDVHFQSGTGGEDFAITAARLRLDLNANTGVIDDGSLYGNSEQRQNSLTADRIMLGFQENTSNPFILTSAALQGKPALMKWESGDLSSSEFDVCFEKDGRQISEVVTNSDAQFTMYTSEGWWMEGRSGRLSMLLNSGMPVQLKGQGKVNLHSHNPKGPSLQLKGERGVDTDFRAGIAYSTRIHGSPSFSYGGRTGQAGSLRILHAEHNILFSDGASLNDHALQIKINGDEILLTNWDKPEQEVFAFKFVEINYGSTAGETVRANGSELALKLPQRSAKVAGTPAAVKQQGQLIEASEITIEQLEEDLFEIQTGDGVRLMLDTAQGPLEILADQMRYSQETSQFNFTNIQRAHLPGQGVLSCNQMLVDVIETAQGPDIDKLVGRGDVIFRGMLEEEGQKKPFSCQASEMDYLRGKNLLRFRGIGKDLVVTHPSLKLKGRELTYNLIDGSMRVDSEAHGISKTTVNLKDPAAKEN